MFWYLFYFMLVMFATFGFIISVKLLIDAEDYFKNYKLLKEAGISFIDFVCLPYHKMGS